jgi:hypothetical protein
MRIVKRWPRAVLMAIVACGCTHDYASLGGRGSGSDGGDGGDGASGSDAPPDIASRLVLWYKFDETGGMTIADSSGNGRDGRLLLAGTGAASFSAAHRVGTGALDLMGTSGNDGAYVVMPASLSAMGVSAAMTIAVWINMTTDRGWSRVFDFNDGTRNDYLMLTPYQSATGYPDAVRFAMATTDNRAEQITNPGRLTAGAWHHLAVALAVGAAGSTYTGKLYIDGAVAGNEIGLTIRPADIGDTPNNWIGASGLRDPYFSGLVDDFRIYDRALTEAEIAALYAEM